MVIQRFHMSSIRIKPPVKLQALSRAIIQKHGMNRIHTNTARVGCPSTRLDTTTGMGGWVLAALDTEDLGPQQSPKPNKAARAEVGHKFMVLQRFHMGSIRIKSPVKLQALSRAIIQKHGMNRIHTNTARVGCPSTRLDTTTGMGGWVLAALDTEDLGPQQSPKPNKAAMKRPTLRRDGIPWIL